MTKKIYGRIFLGIFSKLGNAVPKETNEKSSYDIISLITGGTDGKTGGVSTDTGYLSGNLDTYVPFSFNCSVYLYSKNYLTKILSL